MAYHYTIECIELHASQGRFQKKIKGSSFVGVAATPLKPKVLSCEAEGD